MKQKIAYLTIDDSPTGDFEEKVDFLDSRGIKVIWFCVGEELEKFEDKAIYAIKKGHILGNHSYNHIHFSEISLDEAQKQIEKTDKIIEEFYRKAKIKRPIKVFRFPYLDNGDKNEYGETNWDNKNVKAIQNILKKLRYEQPKFENINYEWFEKAGFDKCLNVDCTYDSFDWVLKKNEEMHGYHDLPSILKRIDEDIPERGRGLNNSKSNEIIMMHAWIPLKAFKTLIGKIINKGIIFKLPCIKE
jgi:peptidoglycan/xylan/chitin deacetylase (PgdA/CDA1 family)|tara:strand:- start:372 stop:1106 length:735 start_codon:yes stop_codon:yes gene_type:complete